MDEYQAFRAGVEIGLRAAIVMFRRARHPALAVMEIATEADKLDAFGWRQAPNRSPNME